MLTPRNDFKAKFEQSNSKRANKRDKKRERKKRKKHESRLIYVEKNSSVESDSFLLSYSNENKSYEGSMMFENANDQQSVKILKNNENFSICSNSINQKSKIDEKKKINQVTKTQKKRKTVPEPDLLSQFSENEKKNLGPQVKNFSFDNRNLLNSVHSLNINDSSKKKSENIKTTALAKNQYHIDGLNEILFRSRILNFIRKSMKEKDNKSVIKNLQVSTNYSVNYRNMNFASLQSYVTDSNTGGSYSRSNKYFRKCSNRVLNLKKNLNVFLKPKMESKNDEDCVRETLNRTCLKKRDFEEFKAKKSRMEKELTQTSFINLRIQHQKNSEQNSPLIVSKGENEQEFQKIAIGKFNERSTSEILIRREFLSKSTKFQDYNRLKKIDDFSIKMPSISNFKIMSNKEIFNYENNNRSHYNIFYFGNVSPKLQEERIEGLKTILNNIVKNFEIKGSFFNSLDNILIFQRLMIKINPELFKQTSFEIKLILLVRFWFQLIDKKWFKKKFRCVLKKININSIKVLTKISKEYYISLESNLLEHLRK
jgi:hypothetical protein